MSHNVLEMDHLGFSYSPNTPVLKDINLSLKKGESLGVVGPNGGGKSTLLKIMVGLLPPNNGTYKLNGEVLTKNNFPRHLISYVPQSRQLNTLLPISIAEMIAWGLRTSKQELPLIDVLEMVGLSGKEQKLVSQLSGGEKQRAMIAQALIKKPEFLILDEPNAGLDSTGQDQLLDVVDRIKNELKTVIVIVDHNLAQIIKRCDHILCLNKESHWHDKKEFLTKNVLESIYHCEFEHLIIHDRGDIEKEHYQCEVHDHPLHDKEKS